MTAVEKLMGDESEVRQWNHFFCVCRVFPIERYIVYPTVFDRMPIVVCKLQEVLR